jgi:hypothetical protein
VAGAGHHEHARARNRRGERQLGLERDRGVTLAGADERRRPDGGELAAGVEARERAAPDGTR